MRGRANWDACGDERMYMSAPSPSTCRLYVSCCDGRRKSKEGEEGWQRRLTYIVVISERPHKFDECCQFQIIHGFPIPKLLLYIPFDCI
uniref:Uncharacterized protein n=1 Tax=Triticum urartu TaxID=4572 RepID=A0A8R7Q7D7_TRIUA